MKRPRGRPCARPAAAASAPGLCSACHILTETMLACATSAPGLGSPRPHLHQDCAHPTASARGLGSPVPHLHGDLARACQTCMRNAPACTAAHPINHRRSAGAQLTAERTSAARAATDEMADGRQGTATEKETNEQAANARREANKRASQKKEPPQASKRTREAASRLVPHSVHRSASSSRMRGCRFHRVTTDARSHERARAASMHPRIHARPDSGANFWEHACARLRAYALCTRVRCAMESSLADALGPSFALLSPMKPWASELQGSEVRVCVRVHRGGVGKRA